MREIGGLKTRKKKGERRSFGFVQTSQELTWWLDENTSVETPQVCGVASCATPRVKGTERNTYTQADRQIPTDSHIHTGRQTDSD